MMSRWLLALCLAAQGWLAGCGPFDAKTHWSGGSLATSGTSSVLTLELRADGRAPALMTLTHRERLGRSSYESGSAGPAWRSELAGDGWTATLLSLGDGQDDEQPVGAILRHAQQKRGMAVIWCSASKSPALEHLYAFLLRLPAESMLDVKDSCDVLGLAEYSRSPLSGADLLRRVGQVRAQRSGAALAGGRPWRVVDILPRLDGNEPLQADALIQSVGGPVTGVRVSFAREPHLACTATTDEHGLARCTLYDTHGHAPHESGVLQPPTVVTFAGRSVADGVDVPVVAVIPTPPPTRCLSSAVPAEVAAGWGATCRGFASRSWTLPN